VKKWAIRTRLILIVLFILILQADRSCACSCDWRGPFLAVFHEAPLVVRGKILRHNPGRIPTMDVLALETLQGGLLDSGLRIQMGDGMYCRPMMEDFPIGSEWILALNGPGAKPGEGLALSHCGEYWLQVDGDMVVGCIDSVQDAVQSISLARLRLRMTYPKFSASFKARIESGQEYRQVFAGHFELVLQPTISGWEIIVYEKGRDENIARLTPPLHGAPNPREIDGWHLTRIPASCPRPFDAEAGPGNTRHFIFSPDVGRSIDAPDAGKSVTLQDIQVVRDFGRGSLTIESYALDDQNKCEPRILWLEFSWVVEVGY
jgi:hypothetical protein